MAFLYMDLYPRNTEGTIDEMVKARLKNISKRAASLRKEIAQNNQIAARKEEEFITARRKIFLAVEKQKELLEKFAGKETHMQLIEKRIAIAHQKIIACSERVRENNKFMEKVKKENRPGRRMQLEGMLQSEKDRGATINELWQLFQRKKISAEQNLTQIQTRWKYSLKFYRDLHSFNETLTKFINPNFLHQRKFAAGLALGVMEQNERFVAAEKRISELLKKIRICENKKDGIDDIKKLYARKFVAKPVPMPSYDEGEETGTYKPTDIEIRVY